MKCATLAAEWNEMSSSFDGVKVFTATKAREREELGEAVTAWLRQNPDFEIVDKAVSQSSDNEFHCLSITLFYRRKPSSPGGS